MQHAIRKVREEYQEFKRGGWEEPEELEYRNVARDAIKKAIEGMMAHEIHVFVGAGRHERSEDRQDYLNGYYVRRLLTEVGDIEVKVPRARKENFKSNTLRAYQRRGRDVDKLIVNCFVNGMSTRKVGKAVAGILGEKVSASTVSRISRMLDELVERYHARKLEDKYRYLYFDGVTLKERGLLETTKRSVLVAYGITNKGIREVVDFRISASESEGQWERFLTLLYNRGLSGKNTKLVVTDGGKGLIKALDTAYGDIPLQGCWAHKARNVLDKVKNRDREPMRMGLNKISHGKNRKEAVRAYWAFVNEWEDRYPRAIASLKRDFDRMLEFMDMPKETWNNVRTTNVIERTFREVRRRTRPMGVCSNKGSLERILFAVFDNLNQQWQDIPLKSYLHKN